MKVSVNTKSKKQRRAGANDQGAPPFDRRRRCGRDAHFLGQIAQIESLYPALVRGCTLASCTWMQRAIEKIMLHQALTLQPSEHQHLQQWTTKLRRQLSQTLEDLLAQLALEHSYTDLLEITLLQQSIDSLDTIDHALTNILANSLARSAS